MSREFLISHAWVLAVIFILLLAAVVYVRHKLGSGVEIKATDAGIAAIPVVLLMAAAGIFKNVELPGGFKFQTAEAIVAAAKQPIEAQVSSLPVSRVSLDAKGGVGEIPRLINEGIEALSFTIGHGGYYGPAIWLYMNALTRNPTFRHVIVQRSSEDLFGVVRARKLVAALNPVNNSELLLQHPLERHSLPSEADVEKWSRFANALNRGDEGALKRLRAYPGFIGVEYAVTATVKKQEALGRMDELPAEWLPVVDKPGGRFVGVVDRSRLTASFMLDISRKLEQPREKVASD